MYYIKSSNPRKFESIIVIFFGFFLERKFSLGQRMPQNYLSAGQRGIEMIGKRPKTVKVTGKYFMFIFILGDTRRYHDVDMTLK